MLTPFEIDGVKSTRAEGQAFLTALDAAQSNVTLTTYGYSVLGNPMIAAKVGSGPVRVAVISSTHGTEPAGREAAFKFLRDLAESVDPAIQTYLSNNAWVFMCTANPDRIDAGIRENANGVDLNRDFLAQQQPETQAMAAWLSATDPVLLLDLHETSNVAIPDTAVAISTNSGVNAGLTAQSALLSDAVESALEAAGNNVVPYPFDNSTAGTALTEGSRIWKASALTFETQRNGGKALALRVPEHMIALQAAQAHHAAHAVDYYNASLAAGGDPAPDPEPPTQSRGYRIRLNDTTHQVAMLRLRVDGHTTTIWTPVP